jgi:hypothetical protein
MDKSLDLKGLVGVLMELRSVGMQLGVNSTEEKIRDAMRKYDLVFGGERLNNINSLELCHSLQNYFRVKADNDELNLLIPEACRALGMKYEPMIKVSDVGKSTEPYCYEITLW